MAVFTGNGSAASPSFTFSGQTDLGIFRETSTSLGLTASGAKFASLSSSDARFGEVPALTSRTVLLSYAPVDGSPNIKVHTGTSNSGIIALTLQNSSNANGAGTAIAFRSDIETAKISGLRVGGPAGALLFHTAEPSLGVSREILRLDTFARLSSDCGGIQFNGDTAAANALDDYEEGSFTPTLLTSSAVPIATTSVACKYVKIGNQVTCWGRIVASSGVSGSVDPYLIVRGLPTAVPTPTPYGYGSASQSITGTLDRKPMFVQAQTILANNDALMFRGETNFTGGTIFEFVVTYRTID